MGREEGWLAEHMLILGVTNPQGRKFHVAAAFPSACGETNFAMLIPPKALRGWRVTAIGEDIAWIKPNADGTFHAINPEAGFFGVAPGTSYASNPNAMETLKRNVIFTNVALTDDGDVWWEGMTAAAPRTHRLAGSRLDAGGRPQGKKGCAPECAVHRVCRAVSVDRSGLGESGRCLDRCVRVRRAPLGHRAARRRGALVGRGRVQGRDDGIGDDRGRRRQDRRVRRDPFAMLPFCGYNVADYFTHWLAMGRKVLKAAEDLRRELVPQGRGRPLCLAGLRREHAGAAMDRRTLRGRRRRGRDAARDDASLRRSLLDRPRLRACAVRSGHAARPRRVVRELAAHDELFDRIGSRRPPELGAERRRSPAGSRSECVRNTCFSGAESIALTSARVGAPSSTAWALAFQRGRRVREPGCRTCRLAFGDRQRERAVPNIAGGRAAAWIETASTR